MSRSVYAFAILLLSGCGRTEPLAPVEVGPGRPQYQTQEMYRGSSEPITLDQNADNIQDDADHQEHEVDNKFIFPMASRHILKDPPPSAENGLNIKADEGEAFWAVASGSVIYAGFDQELGNTVIVRHAGNWVSIYAHAQKLLVRMGQVVQKKQNLGKVGKTGQTDKTMLHFEMRQESKSVNPMDFIR